MEPIAISARADGEWVLVHQCKSCFAVHVNRIAGDDNERDLLALAVRQLRLAPFPISFTRQRASVSPGARCFLCPFIKPR